MASTRVKLGEGGRVVIPAEYRRALGVRPGDDMVLRLEDGELHLTTVREGLRRAQEIVLRHVPAGRSLADELVAERRAEVAAQAAADAQGE